MGYFFWLESLGETFSDQAEEKEELDDEDDIADDEDNEDNRESDTQSLNEQEDSDRASSQYYNDISFVDNEGKGDDIDNGIEEDGEDALIKSNSLWRNKSKRKVEVESMSILTAVRNAEKILSLQAIDSDEVHLTKRRKL
jgi:hypothetical protein